MSDTSPPSRGFVYATTGALYTVLARRAARSLRRVMPDAQIDLFTDQDIDDPVFDRIHPVDHQGKRPKMEALAKSRFDRSVFMDADTMVLADISELFEVLDTHDLAAVHGVRRGRDMYDLDVTVPRAFASVNTGVMAMRRTPETVAFMENWERVREARGDRRDQPSFRFLLYQSDLRFLVLPIEYNSKVPLQYEIWRSDHGAPRILHNSVVHDQDPGDPMTPFEIEDMVHFPKHVDKIRDLLAGDWMLGGDGRKIHPLVSLRMKNLGTLRAENKALKQELAALKRALAERSAGD